MSDVRASPTVAPDAPEAEARRRAWEGRNRDVRSTIAQVVAALLIAGVLVFALITPHFLVWSNIKVVLDNAALTGIVAVSMTPMTLSGNFVSLGTSQTAVGGGMVFVALLSHGMATGLAILVLIAIMLVVSGAQGVLVSAGLNPVITTLAAGVIIYGLTISISNSSPVSAPSGSVAWGNSSVIGIPIDVFVLIVVTLVVSVFTAFTSLGRQTVLTGANRRAARLSGISFSKVTIVAFLLFGLGVGIVSILYAAGYQTVDPANSLSTLTFDAVGAMLVGGVAIAGSSGAPWRAAVGAVFISTVLDALLLRNISSGKVQFFEGIIITGAIILRVLVERRKETT